CSRSTRFLGLQLGIVRLDEGADVVGHLEELGPLLLVEGDRKPAESVDGDPTLLADLQRLAARGLGLQRGVLLLTSLELCLQRVVSHRRSPLCQVLMPVRAARTASTCGRAKLSGELRQE